MKKTIIALMALAGVASAASSMPQIVGGADAVEQLGSSIKISSSNGSLTDVRETHMDNVWGEGDVTDRGSVKFSGAYTVGDNGTFSTTSQGAGLDIFMNSLFDVNAGDVTLSFTADLTTGSAGKLLTFGEDSSWSYTLNVDTAGNLTGITSNGYAATTVITSNLGNVGGAHDYVLSWASPANFFNSGVTNEKDRIITLFVDGTVALQVEVANQNYGSAWDTHYYFGSGLDATYSNVEFHRGSIIPEPTTATLSLLALVGLAARRRRK